MTLFIGNIEEIKKENEELKTKLEEAEQHIKDFEALALEWKDNYNRMSYQLKIEIENLQQIIEEMNREKLT